MAAIHAPQSAPRQARQHRPPIERRPRDPEPAIPTGIPTNVIPLPRRHADTAPAYRRRRLLVLVVLAALLVGGVIAVEELAESGAGGAQATDGQASPIAGEVYVVQPGDNLWSIAERLAPGDDPRPVVQELRERHGGVELEVGDRVGIDGLGD